MYPTKKHFFRQLSQTSLLAILVLATYPMAFYFKLKTVYLHVKENRLSAIPVFKMELPAWMGRIRMPRLHAFKMDAFKVRSAAR